MVNRIETFKSYLVEKENVRTSLSQTYNPVNSIETSDFSDIMIAEGGEGLYNYAKDAVKRNDPDLPGILAHIEQCSVKIAHIEDNLATVIAYRDNYPISLDMEYLDVYPVTEYVFVHGKSKKGAIVVRGIVDFEVEDMIKWFEALQKDSENPFLK